MLAAGGTFIPNSVGNSAGLLAGLPRMARAKLMGRRTIVKFVNCVVNRDELGALAELLGSGAVRVVVDRVYALADAPAAVAHMLDHHARGQVVITV